MTRTFDAAAFQRTFAAAQRCGVDLDDCTSYQRALVMADVRRERTVQAEDYGWWRGRDIFAESDEDKFWGDVRIVTVPERRIAATDDLIPFDGEVVAELWREVLREVVGVKELPLAKLQQHQIAWDEMRLTRRSRNRGKAWSSVLAQA